MYVCMYVLNLCKPKWCVCMNDTPHCPTYELAVLRRELLFCEVDVRNAFGLVLLTVREVVVVATRLPPQEVRPVDTAD